MIHGTGPLARPIVSSISSQGRTNQRKCQTLGIRYYDQFERQESRWYFAGRKLVIDWSDTRISIP
jgi:hypothetical protein